MASSKPKGRVNPVPDGYHTVTAYIFVPGIARLLMYLQEAFGAQVIERMDEPDGSVGFAQVQLGDSRIMLSEARGDWKPMPCGIHLYVEDADATYRQAIEAGGRSLMEPSDQPHGDRMAGVRDVCGNYWWIATRVEDVSPEEVTRRMREAAGG